MTTTKQAAPFDADSELEKARTAYDDAQQKAAAANLAEHEAREERARGTWQQVLDEYDPASLRRDVVTASDRLAEAAAASGLTAALVDYIAAMKREADRADEAEVAAATLGKPAPARTGHLMDGEGRGRTALDNLPIELLARAVLAAAKERTETEKAERLEARRRAIGVSAPVSEEEKERRRIDDRNARRAQRIRDTRAGIHAQEQAAAKAQRQRTAG